MPRYSKHTSFGENTEVAFPRLASEPAIFPSPEGRLQSQKKLRASYCTVWLPSRIAEQRRGEVDRCSRARTGGALVGYWYDTTRIVVTEAIGPGPAAPGEWRAWLLRELARRYEASERRETYLGGWHMRPDAESDGLSSIDCHELQRVIKTAPAWTPHPLMLVFYGTKADRPATAWLAALSPDSALQAELKLLSGSQEKYLTT